ncbi:MAG: Gfo/Idh/MocA family oxidoreductase [Planctomycetes bacterium]|nr:Gfo/Idh/MocA family oxidoreductase [Planctomycetota bacterium]
MSTKKLRAVVVGSGWGGVHARAFAESEHVELAAVWSRKEGPNAVALAKRYNAKLFTDYAEMLRVVKPDVASIAVPESAHAAMTVAALEAGCHVYCEKVIADSRDAAAGMVRRAREKGRLLNIGYNYRYSPSCLYLTKAVRAGQLGTPLFAHLRAFTWCVHHMTDYATSLLGVPVRATGVFERQPLPGRPHISHPELAFPTFVYAAFTRKAYMVEYKGGAVLMAGATDYAPIEEPAATLIIQGSEGRAELDDITGSVTIRRNGREATIYSPSQICDTIGLVENGVSAVKDFARAVASGEPAPIPGEQGLAMLCLEEAILRAANSKSWQSVDLPAV